MSYSCVSSQFDLVRECRGFRIPLPLAELSLGSLGWLFFLVLVWRTQSLCAFPAIDGEVDDCDREDCDPDESQQQPPKTGRSMMDHTDTAHTIYMIMKVLVELKKACRRADSDTSVFQVPRADVEMISFASIVIHKRVKSLQDACK